MLYEKYDYYRHYQINLKASIEQHLNLHAGIQQRQIPTRMQQKQVKLVRRELALRHPNSVSIRALNDRFHPLEAR